MLTGATYSIGWKRCGLVARRAREKELSLLVSHDQAHETSLTEHMVALE